MKLIGHCYVAIQIVLFCCLATGALASEKIPTIVFFKGSCSAGKSTLIRSIDLQAHSLEVVDEDAIVHRRYPEAINERFPTEFAAIEKVVKGENIYHALRYDQIAFMDSASEDERTAALKSIQKIKDELNQPSNLTWKQNVSQSITKEVLERIRSAIQQNRHVLLDTWYIKSEQLNELFPKARTVKVLLYSPLQHIYERFLKRNKEAYHSGNLSEWRLKGQLIGSFCSLYEISLDPVQPIERINPKELDRVFSAISSTLEPDDTPKQNFSFKELSQNQLQKIRSDFLKPYLEQPANSYYISPKEKQDCIINQSRQTKQEQRDLLLSLLKPQSGRLNFDMNSSSLEGK